MHCRCWLVAFNLSRDPGLQTQSLLEVAPAASVVDEEISSEHCLQMTTPLESVVRKRPMAHEHALTLVAPLLAVVEKAGHAVQSTGTPAAVNVMYRPSAHMHSLTLVEPVLAVVANAGHAVQTAAPVLGMYVLSGHGVGVLDPIGQ